MKLLLLILLFASCGTYHHHDNDKCLNTKHMPKIKYPKDTINMKFGMLTVISDSQRFTGKIKERFLICKCDCGKEVEARRGNILKGHTSSCGCIKPAAISATKRVHGDCKRGSDSKEYKAWQSIKERCYNSKNKRYNTYGGRGISMCERWRNSFVNFLNDVGRAGDASLSIDRINTNDGYYKENCRWSNDKTQANNKTKNVRIEYGGETLTMSQWAERIKMNYKKFHAQYRYRGMSMGEIISNNA